jgi:predicted nucleic acid-binding Zn ribbon protein
MKSFPEHSRRSETSNLGDAIDALLKAYRLENRYRVAGVVGSWEKVMGEMIARYTKKIFIKDRTLFVEIISAPLKNELLMSKKQIIKLLNEEAKANLIEEVIFL